MKYLILLIVSGLFLINPKTVSAQTEKESKTLSEAEKKKLTKIWKKKLRKTDPMEFKKIYTEYLSQKAQKGKLESQIRKIGKELDQKQSAGRNIREQMDEVRRSSEGRNVSTEKDEADVTGGGEFSEGLVFKVQVKADASFMEPGKERMYTVEQNSQGDYYYTFGFFRDYDRADEFKRQLRSLKVSAAKVSSYMNGKDIPMKKALEMFRHRKPEEYDAEIED